MTKFPLDITTRYLFFTGKGGVGKTSLACATAIAFADSGRKVLLVSTDPASNLDQVLNVQLGTSPTEVPDVPNLYAMNIDPEAAAAAYRDRAMTPYRGLLPEEPLKGMEEQMSGACTVEIAAFDEFTQLLIDDSSIGAGYDHIIFDTAPTGHTLRLLSLPTAWTEFLDTNERGASCLGPTSALKTQQDRYRQAVTSLSDQKKTTLFLVARPDKGSLAEADRTAGELHSLGIENHQLLINGVFKAQKSDDPVAASMQKQQAEALGNISENLADLRTQQFLLKPYNMVGLSALRGIWQEDAGSCSETTEPISVSDLPPGLSAFVDEIAPQGHGLIMLMGKGGVGKTTVAAAIATALAERGLPVHLTTTDPAAHIADAVGPQYSANLEISRIDPEEQIELYKQKVIDRMRDEVDADKLVLLEEDLRSPCTEEVAVFHAFSKVISQARNRFVVIDTAPTGHTLLLLDATGAYHKEIMRSLTPQGKQAHVTTPMMKLQDPDYTKILIVTLAETTPIQEATELQNDLERAGIKPYGWVINNSIAATDTSDPLLVCRAASEKELINQIAEADGLQTYIVPWKPAASVGYVNPE